MNTPDQESDDDAKRLEMLLDRLAQAGLVRRHLYNEQLNAALFTLAGWELIEAVKRLDAAAGYPSEARDILSLWFLCRTIQRAPHRPPPG